MYKIRENFLCKLTERFCLTNYQDCDIIKILAAETRLRRDEKKRREAEASQLWKIIRDFWIHDFKGRASFRGFTGLRKRLNNSSCFIRVNNYIGYFRHTHIPHFWKIGLGFTLPSPLIFTPTGFGSHLLHAQQSDRAWEIQTAWTYATNLRSPHFQMRLTSSL